jgi:hypothetical protein
VKLPSSSVLFKLALTSALAAIKFYLFIAIFIIPLNMFLAWYEGDNWGAFFTLDFWIVFLSSPLQWIMISCLFTWIFIAQLVQKHHNQKVT